MREPRSVGELAANVRAKNAGPFWLTLDVFLDNDEDFRRLVGSGAITRETIGTAYQVDPSTVDVFEIPALRAIKISFPRIEPAGSFHDRDQHAGQQHIPLAALPIPEQPTTPAVIS